MTAFAPATVLNGGRFPVPISRPTRVPAFHLRHSRSSQAAARHELDLDDLDDLDDDVSIDLYGPSTHKTIESVLVPVAGGPNTDVAITFARNIARSWTASITLLTVLPATAGDAERADAEADLAGYAEGIEGVSVETRVETGADVVATIADLTDSHELVVIGASESPLFRRFFRGTIPERLETASRAPLFVVDRDGR